MDILPSTWVYGKEGSLHPAKGLHILCYRLHNQGLIHTALWAMDHGVRILTGAPLHSVSQITPHFHVGGQYRRRGWARLKARGITAVINMRIEFDDVQAGMAPPNYLHLETVDDDAPTLEHLAEGVAFIQEEIKRGGSVYIHCGSGIGRAPTMAAAYLITTGLTTEEAWGRLDSGPCAPLSVPLPCRF